MGLRSKCLFSLEQLLKHPPRVAGSNSEPRGTSSRASNLDQLQPAESAAGLSIYNGFGKFLCILDHGPSKTDGRGWRPGKLVSGPIKWYAAPLVHFLVTVLRKFRISTSKSLFWGPSIFHHPDLRRPTAFGDFEQICSGHAGTKNFPGTRRGTRDHKKSFSEKKVVDLPQA